MSAGFTPSTPHGLKWAVAELEQYAAAYTCREEDLPIAFDREPYTRALLHRGENIDIVLICFAAGQTSSVHDHRGSNCVVRLLRGRILETLFERGADNILVHLHHRHLSVGDVSGLDGEQIHQITNLDEAGSVLLNFYSPPLQG